MVQVLEIERQPERRRRPDNDTAIQDDELAVGKQVEMFQVVGGFEALGIIECREADALQLFQLGRMFGPGLQDNQPVRKLAAIPHGVRRQTVIYSM